MSYNDSPYIFLRISGNQKKNYLTAGKGMFFQYSFFFTYAILWHILLFEKKFYQYEQEAFICAE